MAEITAVKTAGGCMRPAIKNGEAALIELGASPSTGDCVLYESHGKKFLHRAVSLADDRVVVADDAGVTSAVSIPASSIIGVCRVFPSGRLGAVYCAISRSTFRAARFIKNGVPRFARKSAARFTDLVRIICG